MAHRMTELRELNGHRVDWVRADRSRMHDRRLHSVAPAQVDTLASPLQRWETARKEHGLSTDGGPAWLRRNHRTRVYELGSRVVAAMVLETLWGVARVRSD
jgi:hypothetical protein